MARVPLLEPEEVPEEYRYLVTDNDVGDRAIFRAMANAPEQMQGFMRYSTRLWAVLPERERELTILATARALEQEYEWHQHVRLGREAGLTDAEINAVSTGELDALSDRDVALVAYARALAQGDLRDGDQAALLDRYGVGTVAGVAMLVSHYVATGRTLDAFGIEPEEPFVGWTV